MRLVRPLVVLGALSVASLARAQTPAAPATSAAPPASSSGAPPEAPAPPVDVAVPPAPVKQEGENPYFPVHTRRRYGFTAGIVAAGHVTTAEGSSLKFSQRANRTSTGAALGYGESFWLGGVFTDWFAFHVGMTFGTASKGDHSIKGSGVIFGVETWPLFARGGVFRDLGLGFDFGTGTAEVRSKSLDKIEANGGSASMIRGTVFWDAVSAWKLNFGPYVAYERRDAEVYSQNLFWFGLRTAFYGVNMR